MDKQKLKIEKQKLKKRLEKIEKIKVPQITQRVLRGGLQTLSRRREIRRVGKKVKSQKDKIKERLSLIEGEFGEDFGIMGAHDMEPMEELEDIKLKRTRHTTGFWDY